MNSLRQVVTYDLEILNGRPVRVRKHVLAAGNQAHKLSCSDCGKYLGESETTTTARCMSCLADTDKEWRAL